MEVATLAELLHETAVHDDPYENNLPAPSAWPVCSLHPRSQHQKYSCEYEYCRIIMHGEKSEMM
jgi:hypothetical protein